MKLAHIALGCLGLVFFASTLHALPAGYEKRDAAMRKKFYAFNPQTSKVTTEIAYYAFVASLEDDDKTLARILSWPKPKAEALSRLLAQGFEETKFSEDFHDRPRVMATMLPYLDSRLADALGLREYTQVMTGKIGKRVESFGNEGGVDMQFYPEGRSKPLTLHFDFFSTVGYGDGAAEDRCPNIPRRLHLLNDYEVGKVEFLGVCPK